MTPTEAALRSALEMVRDWAALSAKEYREKYPQLHEEGRTVVQNYWRIINEALAATPHGKDAGEECIPGFNEAEVMAERDAAIKAKEEAERVAGENAEDAIEALDKADAIEKELKTERKRADELALELKASEERTLCATALAEEKHAELEQAEATAEALRAALEESAKELRLWLDEPHKSMSYSTTRLLNRITEALAAHSKAVGP